MAEKWKVEMDVGGGKLATIMFFLLLTACLAADSDPHPRYDPGRKAAPQNPRQGFVDFTLSRINPTDRDYGQYFAEGRQIAIEETIQNGYFWSNAVALALIGCLSIVVAYQHRRATHREWAVADVLWQYEHALTRAHTQVDIATRRNRELMVALAEAREGVSCPSLRPLGRAVRTSGKHVSGPDSAEASAAPTIATSAPAGAGKGDGNGATEGRQMAPFKPDVDLILKVNSLEQQLERSQEQEKHLRRQLAQADQRLQTNRHKDRSPKSA
jgi:hypothetical protein